MMQDYDKEWWEASWRRRLEVTTAVLGPTDPPNRVHTFQFPDPRLIVPGACAMTFRDTIDDDISLTISLGLSQPLYPNTRGNRWEFALYAPRGSTWPRELLYDLVLGHVEHPGWLTEGHCLPLTFFQNQDGKLDCGSFEAKHEPRISPVGSIRSLYLWPDRRKPRQIQVDGQPYFLMVATGITADEEAAGDATSPPHLLLLLRELGIGQITDPNRRSAFQMPRASEIWQKLSRMSEEEVLSCLNGA